MIHRFHACRYPTKPSDTAHKFDPKAHNHVVFIRKNKFFSVPLVNSQGEELSAAELEVCVVFPSKIVKSIEGGLHYRQIEKVIQLAGSNDGVPIGALTSDNRDLWVDVRFTRSRLLPTLP